MTLLYGKKAKKELMEVRTGKDQFQYREMEIDPIILTQEITKC